MKQILFFGLRDDTASMLQLVESMVAVKYVRMGQFLQDRIETFNHGCEIPKLGIATAESAISCESFLVCEKTTAINLRPLRGTGSSTIFAVDQLENPDTITFTAGGIWNEDIVLHGRIATASESQASQYLIRRFHSTLRKTFVKMRAFFVGPKALTMLEGGKRLTISAQSPREFDLAAISGK